MVPRRGAANIVPYLPEPMIVILGGYHAKEARGSARTAVTSRFAQHKKELDIVLDHSVRLERFPEIGAAAIRLGLHVADLVPDDRSEIVKANIGALQLDR